MQKVYKLLKIMQFDMSIMISSHSCGNKAILQSNNTIDPVNLYVDKLQPIKIKNNIIVQLLNNPKPGMHSLTNFISFVWYNYTSSIDLLLTGKN